MTLYVVVTNKCWDFLRDHHFSNEAAFPLTHKAKSPILQPLKGTSYHSVSSAVTTSPFFMIVSYYIIILFAKNGRLRQ